MATQLIATKGSALGAPSMDLTRHNFLAGATFAEQQHSRSAIGGFACQFDRLPHLGTFSDNQPITLPRLFGKNLDTLFEPLALERFMNDKRNVVRFERARDKVVRSGFHRFHRPFDRTIGGDHDDRCLVAAFA